MTQRAIFDDAERLAIEMTAPSFADHRATYQRYGLDVTAVAAALTDAVARGRAARAARKAAARRVAMEGDQMTLAVQALAKWRETLELVARCAEDEASPQELTELRLLHEQLDVVSRSSGLDSAMEVLANLRAVTLDFTKYGKPADFGAQGAALVDRLMRERREGVVEQEAVVDAAADVRRALDDLARQLRILTRRRDLAVADGADLPKIRMDQVQAILATADADEGDDDEAPAAAPAAAGDSGL